MREETLLLVSLLDLVISICDGDVVAVETDSEEPLRARRRTVLLSPIVLLLLTTISLPEGALIDCLYLFETHSYEGEKVMSVRAYSVCERETTGICFLNMNISKVYNAYSPYSQIVYYPHSYRHRHLEKSLHQPQHYISSKCSAESTYYHDLHLRLVDRSPSK